MNKLTINDLDLRGKRVFIRVDFNVPLKEGVVTDDTRIRETLPTLRLAIDKGGRLVLASHLGRPKGGPDPKYSLRPAAKKLEELLGKPIAFALDCVGPGAEGQSKALRDGEVLVLENVRFHPEEEKNEEAFSKQLSAKLNTPMGFAQVPITQRTFAGVHLDLLPSSRNIGHNTATFVIFGSEVCEGKGFFHEDIEFFMLEV